MAGEAVPGAHFSPRRRTAVVVAGEGTWVAYLAGVVKALDAAGVRIDLVLGRGMGALVAAFAAFHAEDKIYGEGGILEAVVRTPPFRWSPFYRFGALSLALAFAFFVAPALLGLVAIVAFPVQAVLREFTPGGAAMAPSLLSSALVALTPYYFPAVALPLIAFFSVVAVRGLASLARSRGRSFLRADLIAPLFDLAPLARLVRKRLWQTVRGTATEETPRNAEALGGAFAELLSSGLGQHGFREVVFYALDTDAAEEVPFILLKDRFSKTLRVRERSGRAEPIDLAGDGSAIFFDALVAALSPPGLVAPVGIALPRQSRFGGEVHRFASSLGSGSGAVADAIACGAEQVIYVTAAHRGDRVSGSLWERLSGRALRTSLDEDLAFAASAGVPVFVVRPDAERIRPFEIDGRAQLGGARLAPGALVDQGARDADRLFIRPLLGEELPLPPQEATIPTDRDWRAGPKEL